jgi:hypothetical protein
MILFLAALEVILVLFNLVKLLKKLVSHIVSGKKRQPGRNEAGS